MLAAPTLLAHGAPALVEALVPAILDGRHGWCQLFSEPVAGSNLAGLHTRAVRDGDELVVTGQKVWTSLGQWADYGILIARTDDKRERHAGLTAFVVPMDLPGLTARPIREMTGSAEFCEVFLDEVALGPEHVLGAVGEGWRVITTGLASERAIVGANAVQLEMMFDDLVALARAAQFVGGTVAIEHDDVQASLAGVLGEVEAAKLIVLDIARRAIEGGEHPSDGPLAKLCYAECYVLLCEHALELLSSAVEIDEAGRPVAARWYEAFLWSRALTISGGSSEIMRGLIGRQLLGLPRA